VGGGRLKHAPVSLSILMAEAVPVEAADVSRSEGADCSSSALSREIGSAAWDWVCLS